MQLIDTHCHLGDESFEQDRDAVVERARRAGVYRMLNLGDSVPASKVAVELAAAYEAVYAAVGIHPHEAAGFSDAAIDQLEALASQDKVVAIGEIGLDYHYDFSPRDIQHVAFRTQIQLARKVGLPIAVHSRESDDDVIRILEEEGAEQTGGVLHCFWGSKEMAKRGLDMGFYLGVGGPVTFKNTNSLRDVLKDIPVDRLIVETDSPYLAPVPKRGKRNEPAYVVHTAEALADLKGLNPAELAEQTTANAVRLFG